MLLSSTKTAEVIQTGSNMAEAAKSYAAAATFDVAEAFDVGNLIFLLTA